MAKRIQKILVVIEGIAVLPGMAFILAGSILEFSAGGFEGVHFVSALLLTIFAGMGLILALAMLSLLKKHDAVYIQTGYDYIFNGIALALIPSGILYAINENDPYFLEKGIDTSVIYAMLIVTIVYFNAYTYIRHRKDAKGFLFVPYLMLLASFALYLYISRNLWSIVGFTVVAFCVLLAAAIDFLSIEKKKAGEKN